MSDNYDTFDLPTHIITRDETCCVKLYKKFSRKWKYWLVLICGSVWLLAIIVALIVLGVWVFSHIG